MPFKIVENDIVYMQTDAIVNAANSDLQMGGGVCGAIFSAAGSNELQKACDKIGHCDTGDAVITEGFNLLADYVIHAVGPVWNGGSSGEAEQLASCYTNALMLALENDVESIAFPLISSGIYGYPKEEAMQIAVSAIDSFLEEHEMMIYLVLFNRKEYFAKTDRYAELNEYLNETWRLEVAEQTKSLTAILADDKEGDKVFSRESLESWRNKRPVKSSDSVETSSVKKEKSFFRFGKLVSNFFDNERKELDADSGFEDSERIEVYESFSSAPEMSEAESATSGTDDFETASNRHSRSLDDVVLLLDESFSDMVLRLIDEKGFTDVEVYKRANLDRKLFSKIRSDANYRPGKITAIALAVALKLSVDEAKDLLSRAGYALSHSYKLDIIIEYYIERGVYNIYEINEALFAFEQPLL